MVITLFLDFSKAFKCLNYSHVLQKLRTLSMEGTESNQFWSNRCDRKQLVQIQYTKDNTTQKGTNQSSLMSEESVARISAGLSAFSTAHEKPIPDWLEGARHTVIYTLMIQFSTST